ncbi:Carbamoyl-phosphate synthase L chain ATP- binding protein [Kyrpidia tusciae DSM 2912]|uniref:biotin carboxylase n=1 Tax=Kyrpidia tusciae (strain DSM 2912 / NBRC 15312 / T2) TaxID=562970 RepID=D5WSI5_KYRT2|nr:acetyl-CoA carboxylase biotin carboxylase subunit [Kyrpidia tusciae]ADG05070.1 Carbamoyl-phosphate synthase L chain ATP- binding protein [Kyrpidia tusciae DSM 2912]
MTFRKILVANRGEIARRIFRTCRTMGIQTVAVYSEADKGAVHVREADEAVQIGPPPAAQSYLNMDAVIRAAKETGAEAVHPGYGFLSENGDFAERCEREGLVFIGPSPEVIRAMGSKIEARRRMQAAGVPVVPGTERPVDTLEEAMEAAEGIGYPLMVKASAGGGGIGMSRVETPEELKKTFESTRARAVNFFGDGALFLEKWVEGPRHIEVQVAVDAHGNAVHLFERECSVQRRHQKVVEESPSPFLNDAMRERLTAAALRGATAIGYRNLGTMEFLFDAKGNFYFLEMNTRLQVEHPVTELITGLDLVEWQIRIAAGERLPVLETPARRGAAVECRVYAEDPVRFLPSPGTVTALAWPEAVRVDTGVEKGSAVTPFYDPMIAKIIAHGSTREEALARMERALSETRIEGIKTNLPFLLEVMRNTEFRRGSYDTGLVQKMQNGKA